MDAYKKILKEGGELMYLMFASLISADNDELTEETKQEMIRRYDESEEKDWDYITEPMDRDKKFQEILYKAAMGDGSDNR